MAWQTYNKEKNKNQRSAMMINYAYGLREQNSRFEQDSRKVAINIEEGLEM